MTPTNHTCCKEHVDSPNHYLMYLVGVREKPVRLALPLVRCPSFQRVEIDLHNTEQVKVVLAITATTRVERGGERGEG